VVGPESAGANPGPVCYKKNGYLAITDANLMLGRLIPENFPKIFGKEENEALDAQATEIAFRQLKEKNKIELSIHEIAYGFLKVANEAMARPI